MNVQFVSIIVYIFLLLYFKCAYVCYRPKIVFKETVHNECYMYYSIAVGNNNCDTTWYFLYPLPN